ncbi:hypothetical protein RYX36_010749 [Vicia faba]
MENGYAHPMEGRYALVDMQNMVFVEFKDYRLAPLQYHPILDASLEALAADLCALSRYDNHNTRPAILNSEASQLVESEQPESQQNGADTQNKNDELRLAQF